MVVILDFEVFCVFGLDGVSVGLFLVVLADCPVVVIVTFGVVVVNDVFVEFEDTAVEIIAKNKARLNACNFIVLSTRFLGCETVKRSVKSERSTRFSPNS